MTAKPGKVDRDLVPRWRGFVDTVRLGELDSLTVAEDHEIHSELRSLARDFAAQGDLFTAADLLGAAIAAGGSTNDFEAAIEVVRSHPTSPAGLLGALDHESAEANASSVLFTDPQSEATSEVRKFRRSSQEVRSTAIANVDASLAFATLGRPDRAVRHMTVAIGLAPESRFVLRSAARLFVHIDQPDRANSLLRASERTPYDPWLLAAELATSQLADRPMSNARAARELLVSSSFSPHAVSELAGELATEEIRHGRQKAGRRFLDQSLIDPNENSVAQATWLSNRADLNIEPEVLEISRGFEARSIRHARAGEWDDAAGEGVRWQRDQPFAIEPALFASYAASIGAEDFELAIQITEAARRTHPNDKMVLNNLAFSLVLDGQTARARETLPHWGDQDSDEDKATLQATEGLVEFRSGNVAAGRQSYLSAFQLLSKLGNVDRSALAALLWAREETLARVPGAEVAVNQALKVADRSSLPEVGLLASRLRKLLDANPMAPESAY